MVVLFKQVWWSRQLLPPLIIPLSPHFTHLPLSSLVPSFSPLGGEGWGGEGNLEQPGAGYLRFQRNCCSNTRGKPLPFSACLSFSLCWLFGPKGPCHSHFSTLVGAEAISKWHAVFVPLSLWGQCIIFAFSLKIYEAVVVSEFMPSHPEPIDLCHPGIALRDKLIRFCSGSSSSKWPD